MINARVVMHAWIPLTIWCQQVHEFKGSLTLRYTMTLTDLSEVT